MSQLLIEQLKLEVDPFAKAKLIFSLIHDHNWYLKDVAKTLSYKPSYICHYLRLNRLPEIIIDGFYSKDVSLSHLFIISRLKNPADMISAYEKVLGKNLTVLQTEELIREMLHHIKTEGESLTGDEKIQYQTRLPKDFKLKIIQTRIKSKLIFEVKGSLTKTTKAIRQLLDKVVL